MTYLDFCIAILQLASVASFRVTSWWRSPSSNKAVGGHILSWHLVGMGVDLVPDTEADRHLIKAHAPRLGFDYIDEGDHIHLEPSG
jgi:hypothetical protein